MLKSVIQKSIHREFYVDDTSKVSWILRNIFPLLPYQPLLPILLPLANRKEGGACAALKYITNTVYCHCSALKIRKYWTMHYDGNWKILSYFQTISIWCDMSKGGLCWWHQQHQTMLTEILVWDGNTTGYYWLTFYFRRCSSSFFITLHHIKDHIKDHIFPFLGYFEFVGLFW